MGVEKLAVVGDVIQPGEDIPGNVTGVDDADRDRWTLGDHGWSLIDAADRRGSYVNKMAAWVSRTFGPLTVTAVRDEPALEPKHCGDVHYVHEGHESLQLNADGHVVKHACPGTPATPRLSDAVLEEPKPDDEPPLLDLVWQYGTARWDAGEAFHRERAKSLRHDKGAEALFDRIAEALAQQPVRARDDRGWPLWQHGCCAITAFADRVPKGGIDCAFCPQLDGPWRPLLVATDPAPDGEVERYRAEVERLQSDNDRLRRAQERTEDDVLQVIAERDDFHEWADRLAQAIAEYFHVDIGEHSNMNLPWQAALIALTDAASPAQPDPLVLTLPKVPRVFEISKAPEGVVRVKDSQGDVWALDEYDGLWHCDEQGWSPLPWHLLLADHGDLVEMAPPREPRTWPKLDSAPDDLRLFKGASGRQYRRHALPSLDRWYHDADEEGHEDWRPLAYWQQIDGPLTEVFDDEPGGQQ
jgi:hypothetical protein